MACFGTYGVLNKLRKSCGNTLLCLFFFSTAFAQPPVTSKWKEYVAQVKADPSKKMVELRSVVPGIVYDLRYASLNNFMTNDY